MKIYQFMIYVAIIVCLTACNWTTPGQGDKVGQIAKINTSGWICTTTDILVTGKFGGGELRGTVPASNPDLMAKVKKFNDSQEQVVVKYHTSMVSTRCNNDTGNIFIDDVEAHPEGAAK